MDLGALVAIAVAAAACLGEGGVDAELAAAAEAEAGSVSAFSACWVGRSSSSSSARPSTSDKDGDAHWRGAISIFFGVAGVGTATTAPLGAAFACFAGSLSLSTTVLTVSDTLPAPQLAEGAAA